MAKIADTHTILRLAKLADTQGFNRRLDTEYMTKHLDPIGVHVCYLNAMVSDFTVRTEWMFKFRNEEQPHKGTLDMPLGVFNRLAEYVAEDA